MYFELLFEGMAGRRILRTAQWHLCQLAEFIAHPFHALAVERMLIKISKHSEKI